MSVVQYATTAASMSPMVLFGVGEPQRQKSPRSEVMAVWHCELGPPVVELHWLKPDCGRILSRSERLPDGHTVWPTHLRSTADAV